MNLRTTLRTTLVLLAVGAFGCADVEDHADDGPATMPVEAVDAYAPSDAERAALVSALQQVFDALESGDGELLRAVMDPEVRMIYTQTDAEGVTIQGASTLEGLVRRIETASEPLIERMWDPEVRVQGDIATIWAPYDFYAGDTFSHCGIDVATLMRGADGWTIVALEWSRAQPPACELHPEGPPGA